MLNLTSMKATGYHVEQGHVFLLLIDHLFVLLMEGSSSLFVL